jgi:hypothetical protein
MEALMQKSSYDFNDNDRRVVRRWWLACLGFYGSVAAGLALYVALSQNPDVNYASVQSTAPASHRIAHH